MSVAELDKRLGTAMKAEQIQAKLPGLLSLTAGERRSAQGRFRTGEAEALLSVLEAVKLKPHLFESLADRNFGADPERVEVALLRDRLQRAARLVSLAEALDRLSAQVGDTSLMLTSETRPVMLEAHGIAKSVARTDAPLRAKIAPAIDFFTKIARKGAKTLKKRQDDRDSESWPPLPG